MDYHIIAAAAAAAAVVVVVVVNGMKNSFVANNNNNNNDDGDGDDSSSYVHMYDSRSFSLANIHISGFFLFLICVAGVVKTKHPPVTRPCCIYGINYTFLFFPGSYCMYCTGERPILS